MSSVDPKAEQIARKICTRENLTFVDSVAAGAFKDTFHVATQAGESRALKLFKTAITERTTREIDAMQRCQHPNIARFFSLHDFTDGALKFSYLLEEYLAGGSLGDRIKQKHLTIDECRDIGRQLIDALGHIAALALVHRDLKPDNIMFRADRQTPVIVDFGLVRDLTASSLTASWVMVGPGTPFFASPEQLNNDKQMIDWRSDQFGLSVTLAVATFGVHPFAMPGDTPQATVQRVAMRQQASADFITRCAQSRLNMMRKMVQTWPILRFRTAADLAAAWDQEAPP